MKTTSAPCKSWLTKLAIAVVNSELFAETQEHLAQHRLLHHITTTAASGTTLDEALQSAVNGLQVTLGGDRVAILLADREKKVLEVRAAVGYANNVYLHPYSHRERHHRLGCSS